MSRALRARLHRLESSMGPRGPVPFSRTIVEGGDHPTLPHEAAAARAWATETGGLLIVVRIRAADRTAPPQGP